MTATNARAKNRRLRRHRRGAAAVEFAVCLPILVILVFGSIEACSFIFLKQSLSVAAYEGAREAALSNSTTSAASTRSQQILDSRGVTDYAISFPGGTPDAALRGQPVTVEVSAPTQTNSPLAGQFVPNRTLVSRVVMLKE
ncbi:TadE-like protein [Novipirellula aureliae]|uniref:TadE-like protein n=1 Tax=Novipirellula aureliae TaxID=2527966 RepID=A0A5C6DXV2_9BACT|nr:TadE/TadG family type IV pilus assembly protein [Novipirellula aureliae]TWU41235.1 TadE-like protein [Novipirellula aureliae]